MTPLQRLQLRQSETRQSLNVLLALDELSDEQRASMGELTSTMQNLEIEVRGAICAEGEPIITPNDGGDAEGRELRALRERISFGEYAGAAMQMRGAVGAEGDYNAAIGIPANRFPLELLAPPLEIRETTDVDAGAAQQSWLDRLFATSSAARVGVSFRSVATGVAAFPVTTAGGAGVQRQKSEAVAAATWTIGVTELKPTRNAIHAIFSREDDLRLPGLEEAITRDLRMGLMDAVDLAIFEGDAGATGTTADITGLQTAASVVEKTITQTAKVKGPDTLQALVELIDGKHAEGASDLRIVASVGANTLWMTTVANSAAENQTIAQFLMASGMAWGVRGDISGATTANAFGAFVGRGRGIDGAAVAPVWDSGELIRDPYTSAAKGEVVLTLNYFWNFGLPRPANFARLKFVA